MFAVSGEPADRAASLFHIEYMTNTDEPVGCATTPLRGFFVTLATCGGLRSIFRKSILLGKLKSSRPPFLIENRHWHECLI